MYKIYDVHIKGLDEFSVRVLVNLVGSLFRGEAKLVPNTQIVRYDFLSKETPPLKSW